MNLPNRGQISNLPKDVVVETYGVINSTGAHALTIGEVPTGVQNILLKHILNQELTIQSALQGDDQLALQVLLNDPLSSRLTVEQARQMLAELLGANKQYLPKFL
jgi:alpha-galactosidase/6-phospho-beta-glucosidase family protein